MKPVVLENVLKLSATQNLKFKIMQILLACAKIMTGEAPRRFDFTTQPVFQQQANENAVQLSGFSVENLQNVLHVSHAIALENRQRYQAFFDEGTKVPAVFAYDGMVFRKLAPETMSDEELIYANGHLLIGSFLYGMLRPLDAINRYRLEGNVVLPHNGGKDMFKFWQPLLTDWFFDRIEVDDGILVNLASAEFKRMVEWQRVKSQVKVITPEFKVVKNGEPRTVVIYTKMCRGAMSRWILNNKISNTEELKDFEYEGFEYDKTTRCWLLK